jgi:hypothetical protein
MPLKRSTSKGAFISNVKAEIAAGRPQRQALAIAYREKRAAAEHKPAPTKRVGPKNRGGR